jgi:hypothetical protein
VIALCDLAAFIHLSLLIHLSYADRVEINQAGQAVLAAAVLALAACSSATPAAPIATTRAAVAADPVAILRETGATPDPGTVYGGHDVFGDRDANGSFPRRRVRHGLHLLQPGRVPGRGIPAAGDDQHGVVIIPANLTVIAVDAAMDGWGGPTPQQIASAVHGLVSRS